MTAGARRDGWVVAGVLLAALNLRCSIVGVGPVLEEIRTSTGLSSGVAAMLTTIPFLCMSAFSLAGAWLLARWGSDRLVHGCLILIGAATLARAAMPSAWSLLAATIPIGVGIALIGAALPAVVKRHFAGRAGAATGAYVTAQSLGGTVASLAVVPLAHALGGWRWALASFALPVFVALPAWRRADVGGVVPGPIRGLPRRPPPAGLLLALLFGLQSVCFTAVITWVAALYADAGWSAGKAALTTGVLSIVSLPASLLVPWLSDRSDRRHWFLGAGMVMTVGMAGLALVPTHGAWLWLALFAIGNGAIFPLTLTLPLDIATDEAAVAALSAWMLCLGYLMSAVGPVGVGALRDVSGGFQLPMVLLAVLGAIPGVLAMTRLPPLTEARRRGAVPGLEPVPVVPLGVEQ